MDDKHLEREITPRALYLNRRTVMRGGVLAASAAATAWLYRKLNGVETLDGDRPALANLVAAKPGQHDGFVADEPMTSRASITNYNNFYEFSTDKDGVAKAAAAFDTRGWQLSVEGLVHKPKVFGLDDLRAIAAPEERIYRMRCVEAWSMVIPWAGLPLAKLLARVEPMASAKYVAFQTLHDPARMPNQKTDVLVWPYVEQANIYNQFNAHLTGTDNVTPGVPGGSTNVQLASAPLKVFLCPSDTGSPGAPCGRAARSSSSPSSRTATAPASSPPRDRTASCTAWASVGRRSNGRSTRSRSRPCRPTSWEPTRRRASTGWRAARGRASTSPR